MGKRKNILNIMLTMLIIFSMSCVININVFAKTSFKKQKVDGVMSTAVKTDIAVTWEPVEGASGYEVYESIDADMQADASGAYKDSNVNNVYDVTVGNKLVLQSRLPGMTYRYYVRAFKTGANGSKIYSKSSGKVSTTVSKNGYSTIGNLLKTALTPVGSTLYVWGGGWNKADTAAGREAKSIGVSASWRSFYQKHKSNYNYRYYRYRIHDGLDCSGYVGWCIYNIRNTANGKKGYVYNASKQAKKFSEMGFGAFTPKESVKDHKAGDIMSSSGHVWITVGQCSDKSVVLLHASAPGVTLAGTAAPSGKKNSEAYKLAKRYMKKYYKSWYSRYPDAFRGTSYLTEYSRMRWDTVSENAVLTDPDGLTDMTAEEVLRYLFDE